MPGANETKTVKTMESKLLIMTAVAVTLGMIAPALMRVAFYLVS